MKSNTQISVWDPLLRLLHWLLVLAFMASWLTQEEYYNLHLQAGYATLGIVCLRIAWGLVGPQHARFTDFIYPPASLYRYLKSLFGGHTKRYTGHNPAGGAMVLLMLMALLTVTISGVALDGAENWSGPLAEMSLYHHTNLILSIHNISSDLLLILIALHLLGVFHASFINRENLIKAMITGNKRE